MYKLLIDPIAPLVAFAFCLMATLAQAAGFRFVEVSADTDGPALQGAIWYPCAELPGQINLGPFTLPGAMNSPRWTKT